MCGLLGMLTAHHNAVDFVPAIERALPCMRHRGPDEAGSWHDTDAVFGFNRLSIIDIAHSHQPLQWGPEGEPDRYAMTFNGEIYNYVELRKELQDLGYTFNTSGDGEPILVGYHHWGKDVVKHLRGMFGIAIWDTKESSFFSPATHLASNRCTTPPQIKVPFSPARKNASLRWHQSWV